MAKDKEESPNLNKLQELMGGINKMFGTGTIVELGEENKVDIECNPVGVPSIDLCLGGGFPVGRIIEVYGPESSGKTSCTLLAIAEAQKKGHICGFIDVEQALDVNYASSLGVDVSKLVLSQPDYGEAAFEVLDRMIESGLFKIIVFDSIAAVTPKAELEGEMGESKMGVVARLVAQMLRKITAKTKKTNTTVIFINQLREKIGVIYGSNETTPGGNSMKFYASQRVDIRKGPQVKSGDIVIGGTMRFKVVKNKIAPPFKNTELEVLFGHGIDITKDYINVAVSQGILEKSGSWYKYEGTNIGQGLDKSKDMLLDNPELFEEIKSKIRMR